MKMVLEVRFLKKIQKNLTQYLKQHPHADIKKDPRFNVSP